jgi:hypothetical protein
MIGWDAQHRAEAFSLPRSDDVPSSVGGCADPDGNGRVGVGTSGHLA